MKSIWNGADAAALRRRIGGLRPDAAPLWGSMDAPRMVVHLTDSAKMALGELQVASRKLPLRYPPLKQLIVYVLPIPRGVPTAPELIERRAAAWGSELAGLERACDRLRAQRDRAEWPDHPAFGSMSRRAWGVLVYKHTDHHLRQFGV